MKKGLKKLVAGMITSMALCLPVVGGNTGVQVSAVTSNQQIKDSLDHFLDVSEQLSKFKTGIEFDTWFDNYWANNSYRYKGQSEELIYETYYGIWRYMIKPPSAGIGPR